MAEKRNSAFRYNTGSTKVPWAAVGEDYNAKDLLEVVRFMMQGEGDEYEQIISNIKNEIAKLNEIATPPGNLSMGPYVQKAEADVKNFLGSDNALFVANATAGFEIACKYANLGPGDEVIVPAITFIATIAYPLEVGAKLVFADLDPKTLCMDPADVARKITPKTKMIIPVHLGGYPVDMDPIMKLAKEHNIIVLEDGAHAFGASYKGKKIGTIADFTGFSFHEVKNCTSFGEGGILTTNIDEMKPYLVPSRFLGLDNTKKIPCWLYDVIAIPGKEKPFVTSNSSVTEIQALGLSLQIDRYEEILAKRRAVYNYMTERFSKCDAIIPNNLENEDYKPSYHLYLLQIDPAKAGGDVQTLKKKLEEKSVTNIPHFGPLYYFDILKTFGYDKEEIKASCPVCEEAFFHRFTHLPLYGLSDEQIEYMINAVLESIEEMKRGE